MPASTTPDRRSAHSSTPRYARSRPRSSQGSLLRPVARSLLSSVWQRAGVTVTATSSDARMLTMYASPSGLSMRPSTPVRKKSGTKTIVMMTVALRIGSRISRAASRMTAAGEWRQRSGRRRFSRRRRCAFSTKMIASSTSAPIAIAIPPSVIVLMVPPSARSVITASASERGMASTEIAVVRAFHRKRKRMATTSRAPSRSAVTTLSTASEMKSACRKMPRSNETPPGSEGSIRSSSVSILRVSSSVLAPGCF